MQIRISPRDKLLLKEAAREDGLSLSSFMVRIGKEKARELGVKYKNIEHPNQMHIGELKS